MEINIDTQSLTSVESELLNHLKENLNEYFLDNAQIYYDFPVYKDDEGNPISTSLLIISQLHGVIAIQITEITERDDISSIIYSKDNELGKVFSALFSRLIRYPKLQENRMQLLFPVKGFIYAPNIRESDPSLKTEFQIIHSFQSLLIYFANNKIDSIDQSIFSELISVVEGAKGIVRPKPRSIEGTPENSRGKLANQIEAEITSFDRQQKKSSIVEPFEGPQRIRGLAGSGKTVVLAWKAALTHIRDRDANIIYTFYTRSLYQHIRSLITRFYRQYEDQDPDWDRLKIMHAWGGKYAEGVYFDACIQHGIDPMTFSDARSRTRDDPFNYACKVLINSTKIQPIYDYIFVDEGQDFPASFINLCLRLAVNSRMVWAYDELQTIWQPNAPTPGEVFGNDEKGNPLIELDADTVLQICYRNPREVLICAHAVGFGLYGKIVQMLENKDHWIDIGYVVESGDFSEGSEIVIFRPPENSLPAISRVFKPEEIVKATVYSDFNEEIQGVCNAVKDDLKNGLRPDDILIVVVDDRAASNYLESVARTLADHGIASNNIHSDAYGIRDFSRKDEVTLSTVHKAKGNEAFSVYVIGVDALFSSYAGVRERNMLFTAMTRTKGWVQVSGIGEWASACKDEIDIAIKNFPYLRFCYPSDEELKIMKRDLTDKGARKLKTERLLERALQEMEPDEIMSFIEQRSLEKKKLDDRKGDS